MEEIKLMEMASKDNIDFFCIGTPKVTGDSVGPMTGTMLKQKGFTVIGTLNNPVTYSTYHKKLKLIRRNAYVVAIDAAVLEYDKPVKIELGPLKPGAATNKYLPLVGDVSIRCVMGSTIEEFYKVSLNKVYNTSNYLTFLLCNILT